MKRVSLLCVLFACLAGLLSACGGGGGGNSSPAQLSLSTDLTSLPSATVNVPYNQIVLMTASGGTSPYQYSCAVSGGAGLSASVSSAAPTTGGVACQISGTPLDTGAVTLNLSVSDSAKASASAGPLSVNIITSSDPLAHWHVRNPLLQGNGFSDVTYDNGTFVAVGDCGGLVCTCTSPDGVTWTYRKSDIYGPLHGVTYGNGTFVAVGGYRNFLSIKGVQIISISPDGLTWTDRSSDGLGPLTSVTYGNGTFVAVGVWSDVYTSPDGVTWTYRDSGIHAYLLSGVTYGNGTFVAVGTSFDAQGGSKAVLITSPDGVTWTSINAELGTSLNGVTYGNGSFVVVGESGAILTSSDGITWASRDSGLGTSLNGVTYGNGTFVAVGWPDTILQSDPLE